MNDAERVAPPDCLGASLGERGEKLLVVEVVAEDGCAAYDLESTFATLPIEPGATLLPMAWIVSRILASKKSKKN